MKRPAIFFDRDNTIIVSDGYLGDPEKVVLMDGAADALARARSLGFATVIVSNQSGVARGMFGEDAVKAVNRTIDEMLLASNRGAVVDRHEYCPFHPEAVVEGYRQDSDLRKPKPGMILAAADKLALDLSRSWLIGDAPRDIEAGRAAGCRTILFQPPNVAESPAAQAAASTSPEHTATTLKDALDFVQANLHPSDGNPGSPAPEREREPSASLAMPGIPPPPRLEALAEMILDELRKRNQQDHYSDFSVSKLMAGIVQVVALAMLFLAYLNRLDVGAFQQFIFFGLFLQVLTIALLVMSRQK